MSVLVGRSAPQFKATAVFGKDFKEIQLSDFRGKYVALFFYPLDFTFVCPTELVAFQDLLSEFKSRNCEVLGCSVDSQFSHKAWLEMPRNKGGIEGIQYGLVADPGGKIARDFDVLSEGGVAFRGTFLIDKNGIVQHQVINNLPLGRNVEDTLRTLDALQHVEKHGEVCPANWSKGKEAIHANHESVGKYLAKK